jgi:hypothetical protein
MIDRLVIEVLKKHNVPPDDSTIPVSLFLTALTMAMYSKTRDRKRFLCEVLQMEEQQDSNTAGNNSNGVTIVQIQESVVAGTSIDQADQCMERMLPLHVIFHARKETRPQSMSLMKSVTRGDNFVRLFFKVIQLVHQIQKAQHQTGHWFANFHPDS